MSYIENNPNENKKIKRFSVEMYQVPSDKFFDKQQLKIGMEIELEHTPDKKIAKIIAKHHILENKDYYKFFSNKDILF